VAVGGYIAVAEASWIGSRGSAVVQDQEVHLRPDDRWDHSWVVASLSDEAKA
jgi:hypothetical protein